jgi:hypothetical protein
MSTVETIELFPVKIFKTKCLNQDKIKKYLMDNVYPDFVKKGPNDLTQNTYTDYIDGATFVHWPRLYALYESSIKELLQQIGFQTADWQVTATGWYNFTTNSTRMFVHDHTGGPSTIQFAVVHYVNLENNSQGTVFQNPWAKNMKMTTPTKDLKLIPDYFLKFNDCPVVEEGDMVLFPSWLDHSVPLHTNGSLRVTTALNIVLRVDNSDGA